MTQYNPEDLQTLTTGEGYRQKIGMYLSADRQEAINLALRELIVNVQDEYGMYQPKDARLQVALNTKDKIIVVTDNLRGIPVGVREDGINSLEAAFLLPHSGAKHAEGAYSSAVGVNGQGAKIVCHTAEWLNCSVVRDGKHYVIGFKSNDKGAYIDRPLKETAWRLHESGTSIQYKPDARVFGDIFIDVEKLKEMLQELSLFTKGLKIELDVDGEISHFFSENGLVDGLKNDLSISKPFSCFYKTPDCEVELALQWVQKGGEVKGYANGLYMPNGGAFMTSFKSAITRQFNILSESKFEGDKIRNCLDGFCSVKVRVGQFTNQQKTALANPEAREPVSKAVGICLKEFVEKQPSVFESLVLMLSKIEKAELAAERARVAVMQSTKEIERVSKKKVFASDKLKDAIKLGQESILLLCEGKSAVGSLSQVRDPSIYGLLELRGKVINALTNPIEKVMSNEEVQLIFSALGIVPNRYVSSKLRYGKIGIATDSDQDGNHITLLLLTLFAQLIPELLREKRVYRLEAPIYKVEQANKAKYYFTEEEFEIGKQNTSGQVTMYKGLGEMSPKDVRESMFKEQRLAPFIWTNEEDDFLTSLMGPDVEPRKKYVFENIDFSQIRE